MDVNWYVSEVMVDEELRSRRAEADVAPLATLARRHRARRLIGAMLIKLGRALVAESARPSPKGLTRSARVVSRRDHRTVSFS